MRHLRRCAQLFGQAAKAGEARTLSIQHRVRKPKPGGAARDDALAPLSWTPVKSADGVCAHIRVFCIHYFRLTLNFAAFPLLSDWWNERTGVTTEVGAPRPTSEHLPAQQQTQQLPQLGQQSFGGSLLTFAAWGAGVTLSFAAVRALFG